MFCQKYMDGKVHSFASVPVFAKFIKDGVSYANTVDGLPTVSVRINKDQAIHLATLNKRNRPFNKANATALRVDMELEQFLHSADPLIISVLEELLSGQNRLAALIDCGEPQTFNMTFGMTFEDAITSIDRGSSRTPSQVIQYTCGVSGEHSGICRMAWFAPGVNERKTTGAETVDMTRLMLPLVLPSVAMLKGCPQKANNVSLQAAVARAIPHTRLEILEHFCDIYRQGPDYKKKHDYETGPLHLREYIMGTKLKGSREARRALYARVQSDLAAFIKQKDRKKSRSTTSLDCFPLVGEAKEAYDKWTSLHAKHRITSETTNLITKASKKNPLVRPDEAA
jgi:hypothetical protein